MQEPVVESTTTTATVGYWDWMATKFSEYGLQAVGALIFLAAGWMISSWISRVALVGMTKARVDVTLAKFLAKLIRWALIVLALIAGLGIFGVQTASFAAVIGAAGLAIGLAMQGSLGNLAAGIMLLLFRPFRVGDAVIAAGQSGRVDEIELFSTIIDTWDNRRVIIPNSQVFNGVIENHTHHPDRRVDVSVGVDYSADIPQTRAVLASAAAGVAGLAPGREPTILLMGLGQSSVDWQVQVWTPKDNMVAAKQDLLQRIKDGLDGAGIGIPYPQMVVHEPRRG